MTDGIFLTIKEPDAMMTITEEGDGFVIQEHRAHPLHYDQRLERDAVLKSWVVPIGIPEVQGWKLLGVAVDDHPLEYGNFEGIIPKANTGRVLSLSVTTVHMIDTTGTPTRPGSCSRGDG